MTTMRSIQLSGAGIPAKGVLAGEDENEVWGGI
jgi:hypothetical protein